MYIDLYYTATPITGYIRARTATLRGTLLKSWRRTSLACPSSSTKTKRSRRLIASAANKSLFVIYIYTFAVKVYLYTPCRRKSDTLVFSSNSFFLARKIPRNAVARSRINGTPCIYVCVRGYANARETDVAYTYIGINCFYTYIPMYRYVYRARTFG